MKKTISVILILTIMFCLVGCSKNNKNSDKSSKTQSGYTETDGNTSQQDNSSSKNSENQSSVKPSSAASSKNTNNNPSTNNGTSSKNNNSNKNFVSSSTASASVSLNTAKTNTENPEKITKVFSFKYEFEIPEFKSEIFYDSENGNVIPYRFVIPDDYDPSKRYPVILYLHGAGSIGTDNKSHIGSAKNMFKNNGDLVSQAIVICPQSNEWWNLDREFRGDQKGTLGSVLHLLEEIKRRYSCDNNRIYVTGPSMGGYATWSLLQDYGELFAAGIPVCGGGDSSKGYALKEIPIKIYHSKDDTTVPFSNSMRMYKSILDAGGVKVDFIQLDGLGHNSWSYAYSDRDAFCWLFAQNKATNPTCEYEYIPYFRVTNAKGETVISDEDVEVIFYSQSFDEKNTITVDLVLNYNGINKLKKAYASLLSKEFTVYWSTQKLYTFTASGPLTDDTFSIIGIFNDQTVTTFYETIERVISQN